MAERRAVLGQGGEEMAAQYLRNNGLVIVDKRVHLHFGEIDLIARDGEEWVFVEVKTRTNATMGRPEDAFTPAKAKKMARAVNEYLHQHGLADAPVRCDIIAIELDSDEPLIRHYPAVLSGEGLA